MSVLGDAVAREVMGFELKTNEARGIMYWKNPRNQETYGFQLYDAPPRGDDWTPDTNWRDAGRVVDRMECLGYILRAYRREEKKVMGFWLPEPPRDTVRFATLEEMMADEEQRDKGYDSWQEAICQGALKAIREGGR